MLSELDYISFSLFDFIHAYKYFLWESFLIKVFHERWTTNMNIGKQTPIQNKLLCTDLLKN